MGGLTAAILSKLICEGVKEGASICFDMLKKKLQGWLVDDKKIEDIVNGLKTADINEDLAEHAIERRINQSETLITLLSEIKQAEKTTIITQSSTSGSNIAGSGNAQITIGSISVNVKDGD